MEYTDMSNEKKQREPGVCIPWQEKRKELPEVIENEELAKKVWQDIDSLAYVYIWQCLLSF